MLQEPPISEYYPKKQDSHIEIARLEPSFIDFFKQSLVYSSPYCTDPQCCLVPSTQSPPSHTSILAGSEASAAALRYPLSLFADLPDLPAPVTLHALVQDFQERVIPSLPWTSGVFSLAANQASSPLYLLLCKGLTAAATRSHPESQQSRHDLWRACHLLITGTVEVDNSLATAIEWLAASILFIAVGTMSADPDYVRQTNIINGYVQPTLFHPNRLRSVSVPNPVSVRDEIRALRCFYLVVDTIRSIHFQTPSTVDPTWSVTLDENGQDDLQSLCDSSALKARSSLPTLSTDALLLVLTNVLSSINTLMCSLGPFTAEASCIRYAAMRLSHPANTATATGVATKIPIDTAYSRHIPLSVDREFDQLKRSLQASLRPWLLSLDTDTRQGNSTSCGETSTYTNSSLTQFASLLLESGPGIYALPTLVGYTIGSAYGLPASLPRPCLPHWIGIHFTDRAVQLAIAILESVEASVRHDKRHSLSSMWYPIVLFYGALVIWSRVSDDSTQASSTRWIISPSKMLHDFYSQLQRLQDEWDCAREMAQILKSLINTTFPNRSL